MKWIGISGSWKFTNRQIENDVRKTIRNILLKRNQEIINASDELYAFQANKSKGIEDTIKKAEKRHTRQVIFIYNYLD